MRYHFVTFSNENYDPTANYVLEYLKKRLAIHRNERDTGGIESMHQFISSYIKSLKLFFQGCKEVIERAKHSPRLFKLFSILHLSATLYPLVIKLYNRGILENNLTGENSTTLSFLRLVEMIEVRVYKTRGTDPKADIARLVFEMDNKTPGQIEDWLLWFNGRWMPTEQFQSILVGNVYPNRALNHIFITFNESAINREYTIDELKNLVQKNPNIEHILAQTPNFDPQAFGFIDKEDFVSHEHRLGNLTLLEKSLNASIQNQNATEKVGAYDRSSYTMTKKLGADIDTAGTFTKRELLERTKVLADFCSNTWWC